MTRLTQLGLGPPKRYSIEQLLGIFQASNSDSYTAALGLGAVMRRREFRGLGCASQQFSRFRREGDLEPSSATFTTWHHVSGFSVWPDWGYTI